MAKYLDAAMNAANHFQGQKAANDNIQMTPKQATQLTQVVGATILGADHRRRQSDEALEKMLVKILHALPEDIREPLLVTGACLADRRTRKLIMLNDLWTSELDADVEAFDQKREEQAAAAKAEREAEARRKKIERLKKLQEELGDIASDDTAA